MESWESSIKFGSIVAHRSHTNGWNRRRPAATPAIIECGGLPRSEPPNVVATALAGRAPLADACVNPETISEGDSPLPKPVSDTGLARGWGCRDKTEEQPRAPSRFGIANGSNARSSTSPRGRPRESQPMEKCAHHQRNRTAPRGAQAPDQDPRQCCPRPRPQPCCSGRCSPLVRSRNVSMR